MRTILQSISKVFSSLALSCVLLLLLGLLTWLGTLEQVNTGLFEVQKKYFESTWLIHDAGPLSIPLPGGKLVLSLLFLNLIWGGIVRLRQRSGSKVGILIAHFGIGFLLVSGFIKLYFSNDGHVTLFEKEQASYFQSYYKWEIAVSQDLGDGQIREHLVPEDDFEHVSGAAPVTLHSPELPFDLEVSYFMENCRPLPKGPMFDVSVPVVDGFFLKAEGRLPEAEHNTAGAYVAAIDRKSGARSEGVLYGRSMAPFTVTAGGQAWAIDLRRERYPMPFTLALEKFTKEDHPRMSMARVFSSAVTVIEDGSTRPVEISMNEPLREKGLVLFQSGWGPQDARPGDPLFSTFSVVRNPADQFPLWACIVIAAGFLLHFGRKLNRYIRVEARTS